MLDPNNYTIQHVEHEVEKLDIDDGLKDVILATLDRYTKDKKAIKQVHDAYENLDKEKKEKELLLLVAESELEALRAERKAMMKQANIGYIYSQGLRDLNNIGLATIYKEQQKFILSASQRETAIYADPVQPSPAVAVPEFLLEMSKQMREQDSRSTSHPFWQVRCKRYIVTEQDHNEHHWEICGDDGVIYSSLDPIEELHEYLIENHSEFVSHWNNSNDAESIDEWFDATDDDLPDGLRLVYVQEIEEVVTTHFTEVGARAFIARKQHDYPKLYTYVESAYWSPQIRQLQDWIISLSTPTPPNDERPDIVSTLKDLSVRMIDIGAEMEYTAGFNAEMAAHGRELVGAGMIASDWADKIKESEHEANGCSRVND